MTEIEAAAGDAVAKWRGPWRERLAEAGLPADDLDDVERAWRVRDGAEFVAAVGVQGLGDQRLLRSLVVAPARRGAGWGQRLLAQVESALRQDGVQSLWLLTTEAAGYFRRLGYEDVPRTAAPPAIASTQQFRGLCPASAVLMVKRLD